MKIKPLILWMALASSLAACGQSAEQKQTPPPPEVTSLVVKKADVPRVFEYVGQVSGFRDVEVRARVGGIVMKRLYEEGRHVKQGDPLFLIDQEPMRASFDQAKAALAVEEARLQRARQEFARIRPLVTEKAVSQKDYDDAVASLESAQASAAVARARLREAQINMNYTKVTAPISGMTSKEVVSEGSLVGAGQNGLLTIISQVDPVYVNFSMADNDALLMRRMIQNGQLIMPRGDALDVELRLADGTFFKNIGRMSFTDNLIDPTTGTLRARAQFDNPDGELLPGQFVRVFMKGAVQKNTLLVPQRAVMSTAQGTMVMTINKQNIVEPRPVKIGQEIGRDFVIEEGLKGGETIIVDGIMKARPGSPVTAIPLVDVKTPNDPKAAAKAKS